MTLISLVHPPCFPPSGSIISVQCDSVQLGGQRRGEAACGSDKVIWLFLLLLLVVGCWGQGLYDTRDLFIWLLGSLRMCAWAVSGGEGIHLDGRRG